MSQKQTERTIILAKEPYRICDNITVADFKHPSVSTLRRENAFGFAFK